MTRYLVASIPADGRPSTAAIIDAVDETYAATTMGLTGAEVYVVAETATKAFTKAVPPPAITEISAADIAARQPKAPKPATKAP